MHNWGQSRPLLEDNSTAPDSEAQDSNAPESKYPDKNHGLLDYYILFLHLVFTKICKHFFISFNQLPPPLKLT